MSLRHAWRRRTIWSLRRRIRRLPNVGMPWAFQCSLSLCCTAHTVYFSRTGGSTRDCFACRGRRPRRPIISIQRAAARCGVQLQSAIPLSGSGRRGQQLRVLALAATSAAPFDSPPVRGVKGKPPLVAFLRSSRTISFREQERNGSCISQVKACIQL